MIELELKDEDINELQKKGELSVCGNVVTTDEIKVMVAYV